jgi:hypothetical protein
VWGSKLGYCGRLRAKRTVTQLGACDGTAADEGHGWMRRLLGASY